MGQVIDWNTKMAALAAAAATRLGLGRKGLFETERDPEEDHRPPAASEVGSALIWIEYESAGGAVTSRNVTLRKVWRTEDAVYFRGRCHERGQDRTFRADRVLQLACLVTGEAPDAPEDWLNSHAAFDPDYQPGRRVGPRNHLAMRAALPGVSLLMFLAKADGFLDPDEIEVAVDYVMMSSTVSIDRQALAKTLARMSPDAEDLDQHFSYFLKDPKRWERLRLSARRMVDADGEVVTAEQIAWTRIDGAYAAAEAEKEAAGEARLEALVGIVLRSGPSPEWLADHGVDRPDLR